MKKLVITVCTLLVLAGCSSTSTNTTIDVLGETLIRNGNFDQGEEGWRSYYLEGSGGSKGVNNSAFCFDITNKGSNSWNIQINQDVKVQAGKTYRLSFTANASKAVKLKTVIEKNYGDYASVGTNPLDFSLVSKATDYVSDIEIKQDDQVRVNFSTGGGHVTTTPVTVCLDNVYLGTLNEGEPLPQPTEPTTPAPTTPAPSGPTPGAPTGYQENLKMIQSASVRNTNHDTSAYKATPQNKLPLDPATSPLFGSRQEYVQNGEPGVAFANSGSFRIFCEFSHFAYDDPIVFPGQVGGSHLHMYFGNTDTNAFSTYDTLKDSGSSTCNGQELNRTSYWVPALFDSKGNVRVPQDILIYYKGQNQVQGRAMVYPPGAAMVAKGDKQANNVSRSNGGTLGMSDKVNFMCTDAYNSQFSPVSNTIPDCAQSPYNRDYRQLKMHVRFPICWNRQDASNPDNWFLPVQSDWYWGECGGMATTPQLEYILYYKLDPNESTAGWYLASDVDPVTRKVGANPGSSTHADWWGGWHPDINKQWIDNCVNYKSGQAQGCGNGYLSDHGPDVNNPYPGPALKLRPQYTGVQKVSAETLYRELCPQGGAFTSVAAAAYCTPSTSSSSLHSHH